MARRKLSIATRWQVVGMANTGLSCRRIAVHFGVNHTVIIRLVQRYRQTGSVEDRPRAGRPRKTTPREDRNLSRQARLKPFSSADQLRRLWSIGGRVSVRTVIRRLHSFRLRARRPIKRPELTLRHRKTRLQWARNHRRWTLRSWRRIHWSDESRFLLKPVDGRTRVWRERNTAYRDNNILGTTAFGGGGVTVWGCFSHDCKLDMHVLHGTLNGQRYRDDILNTIVSPHFDNHALADRPVFQDDNARPHRARIVNAYLTSESIDTLPWPAMSPNMNPIEHVWDFIGRKLNQRQPKCATIPELRVALVQEWQRFPQYRLRRLVQGMRRRVLNLYRKRGIYTRY